MTLSLTLVDVRTQIDGLDKEIQQRISQRAALALEVARLKTAAGEGDGDFYRPEREAQVLREVMARNTGELADAEMARIFREIMSTCLAAEKPVRVAYLGPEGSFTDAATQKHFGGAVHAMPFSTISDVFRAVETGESNYGVVPVENSTEGMITHTLDRFISSPLNINGEVSLRIHHYFLSSETSLADIDTVYAHPQALAQCRKWLSKNLPNCTQIPVNSNSEAARQVANKAGSAAIAANRAAEIYGLNVIAKHIEDEANNTTRFLVIGHQNVPPSGDDKTALLVSTKNQSGALQKLLTPLADSGISLSRIESRPAKTGTWEYVFFIDIDGHSNDEAVAQALDEINQQSSMCRVLGSYPKAVF